MNEWMMKHRLKIGYTAGVLNIVCGLINIAAGSILLGIPLGILGVYIIFDIKSYG